MRTPYMRAGFLMAALHRKMCIKNSACQPILTLSQRLRFAHRIAHTHHTHTITFSRVEWTIFWALLRVCTPWCVLVDFLFHHSRSLEDVCMRARMKKKTSLNRCAWQARSKVKILLHRIAIAFILYTRMKRHVEDIWLDHKLLVILFKWLFDDDAILICWFRFVFLLPLNFILHWKKTLRKH